MLKTVRRLLGLALIAMGAYCYTRGHAATTHAQTEALLGQGTLCLVVAMVCGWYDGWPFQKK